MNTSDRLHKKKKQKKPNFFIQTRRAPQHTWAGLGPVIDPATSSPAFHVPPSRPRRAFLHLRPRAPLQRPIHNISFFKKILFFFHQNPIFLLLNFRSLENTVKRKMPSSPPSPGSRQLRELQSRPGNGECVDCGRRNDPPESASVTYGVFMCHGCSGTHHGLGVRLSFVRSAAADASWPGPHLRVMASNPGGNQALNAFLAARGVPPRAAIPLKYSSPAAALFRSRLHALAHRRPFSSPSAASPRPPRPLPSDDWDEEEEEDVDYFQDSSSSRSKSTAGTRGGGIRRNQLVGDDLGAEMGIGDGGGRPCRSWSSGDILAVMVDRSGIGKEMLFERMMVESRRRPEGKPAGLGSTGGGDLISDAVIAMR